MQFDALRGRQEAGGDVVEPLLAVLEAHLHPALQPLLLLRQMGE